MSIIGGWGRGAWGEGAWGQPVPVVLTGVSATTGVGTVLAGGGSIVGPVGAVGTIGFGDEQVTTTANVAVTGVTATIATSTPTAPAAVTLTGLSATVSTTTPTFVGDAIFSVTGNSASITAGSPAVDDFAFGVTGLSATGNVGIVFIWGQVVPDQTASWSEITSAESDIWTEITPSQTPDWKEVA